MGFSRRHVLVTGANGFLGRACTRLLADAGYSVTAIFHSSNPAPADDRIEWRRADLTNSRDIGSLFHDARPTHLLALAWQMGPDHRHSVENYLWIGYSLELLFAFARKGGRRAIFCGTCAEYDWSGSSALHETQSTLRPTCDYGAAKAALFQAYDPMMARIGLSAAWARPFFLYGPGEDRWRLVANVVAALMVGREALCTEGTQRRDFLHVNDAAHALVMLLGSDVTGPVNIASGEAVPVARIVAEIGRQMERTELIRLGAIPTPPDESRIVEADIGRLRKELGFTPRFHLASGLADTIAWWRAQAEREHA